MKKLSKKEVNEISAGYSDSVKELVIRYGDDVLVNDSLESCEAVLVNDLDPGLDNKLNVRTSSDNAKDPLPEDDIARISQYINKVIR